MRDQGKILRFWRDVEIFMIPAPAARKDEQNPGPGSTLPTVCVKKYTEPLELPWPAPAPAHKPTSIVHAIYLGVQDMGFLAKKVLETVAPAAELSERDLENISGQGCLGIFCVNKDGVPLAETYTAASFVLGVDACRKGMDMEGLARSLGEAQKKFDERRFALKPTTKPDDAETGAVETDPRESETEEKTKCPYIPLTWQDIREECQILFDCLGFELPEQITVTVKTTATPIQVNAKKDKEAQPQPEMLNSFYLNDLDTLIRQCDQNAPFGNVLSAYLGNPSAKDSRRDILQDDLAMFGMLNPAFLPSGRWPSLAKNHLLLGQQAAVSGILTRAAGDQGGLVAVNGPPGTGKTTLLSDIIAEVVVRRAETVCTYDKPWLIFDPKISSEGNAVFPLKKSVARNTGIVVSSNNNSAVENITLDLPSRSKIAREEHPGAAYFNEVINGIFSRSNASAEPWGLVAGALGSKANRKRFFDGFLWGSADKSVKGMKGILNAVPKDTSAEEKWHAAKKKFLSLKCRIEAQKKEFNECHEAMLLRRRLCELMRQENEAVSLISRLQLEKEGHHAAIEMVRLDKPGMLDRLSGGLGLKTQAYKAWEGRQKDAQRALLRNIQQLNEAQAHKDALLSERARLEESFGRQGSGAEPAERAFGPLPDEHFFTQPQEARHLSHVWTTDAFDLLRSQYFLAALDLHEATILACSGKFSANFSALGALLTAQGYFSQEARAALWDSLFFTVPVISTTLASFDRLFSGMEQNSIGWLLIDEAGQATPQSVAGALWRSQRAVIIGDPLQIEPVLTIPEQLVVHLQKKYELEEDWSPKLHSAQTLADRTMDAGAWVGSGETAVWTGLPLRAHRRCADPMFSISNSIAYDGQMVQANTNPAEIKSCLNGSKWFDVQSAASDGQIVQAELDELRNLLKKLRQDWPMVSGCKKASVYIISPFRRVAAECRTLVRQLGLEDEIQAGTVHTFQGKEADIVFIVLGSAPGGAGAGSRNWASEKPNILNVALTRAKLLVYVIGNKDDWKACRGFDELADALG